MRAVVRIAGIALALGIAPTPGVGQPPPALPPSARPELLPDPTVPSMLPAASPSRTGRPTVLPDSIPEPESPSQVVLNVEYRFLRPRRQGNDFAIIDRNTDDIPEGSLESVFPSPSSGFRASIGYIPRGSPWQTSFAYTYFRNLESRGLVAPAGGLLFATKTRPGLVGLVDRATAESNWEYDLFDLELGRNVTIDPTLGLRAQVGGRFASIGQESNVLYDGREANRNRVVSDSRFSGAGLLFGGEIHWTAGRGLSFFGRARTGLMLGASRTRLRETQDNGVVLHGDLTERVPQSTPVLEMGLGTSYRFRGLTIRGGYDIAHWFQLLSLPDFADDINVGKTMRQQSPFSLDGFFVQFGYNF